MGTASTPEDSTSDTTDDSSPQFADVPRRPHCDIDIVASVTARKSMHIEPPNDIVADEHFDGPDWQSLRIDAYRCRTCEEDFDTEEQAEDHLKRMLSRWRSRYGLPGTAQETQEKYQELMLLDEKDENTIDERAVVLQVNRANTVGIISDGLDHLFATTRHEYSLPADYNFDEWGPLNSGRLCFPNGDLRITVRLLEGAIGHLAPDPLDYDPEKFTLYERGDSPFLLTGPKGAIVIAPLKAKNPLGTDE